MCCTSTTAIFGVDVDEHQTIECLEKCQIIFSPDYVEPKPEEGEEEEDEEESDDEDQD